MSETNIIKLLDVLEQQRRAADEHINLYDSLLKLHPNDANFKERRCFALAEFLVTDNIISMIKNKQELDYVYSIYYVDE